MCIRDSFVAWVATPTGTLVAAGAALAVIVVLFALSSMLAVRLYEKREF